MSGIPTAAELREQMLGAKWEAIKRKLLEAVHSYGRTWTRLPDDVTEDQKDKLRSLGYEIEDNEIRW